MENSGLFATSVIAKTLANAPRFVRSSTSGVRDNTGEIKMKRLLLATVIAFAATTASAGTIKLPEEYLGSWCITQRAENNGRNVIIHERCDTDSERTFVGPDSLFNYTVGDCHRLVKSELSPPYGNGVRTFIMTYQCRGGKLTAELYAKNDNLFVTIKGSGK
jgi:hypothetical protein